MELGVLGPLQVRQGGLPVAIPGAKPRAVLTMLGLHGDSVVSAETLVELLWGDDPPRTVAKALQTHISSLRHTLGDGFVLTQGTGWILSTTEVDATRYTAATKLGRDALAVGDAGQAVAHFDEALALWRGVPELPDGARGSSEKTRWIESHAALVEDRADALLATGRAAEIIGELEAAVADAPLRERRWGHLMLALYRAGRQGEALGAYQRARSVLAEQLGVDPGPDLRRLHTAVVAQDRALEIPSAQHVQTVTRAVTFLLTDIEGSTAAWEADADAMAIALARHDELVEQVVTSRGGRLVKTRGEGDATFSVFDRPSAASAAAIELQEAIRHEPWALQAPMRVRVALHTGEVEFRDGDYFGRAVNRAARLRSLAVGGQILCSGATAELVIDSLSDDVVLTDLGMRQLRNLARPEHVFELRLMTVEEDAAAPSSVPPMERPPMPSVLSGPGPFVGRDRELEGLFSAWQTSVTAGTRAVLIAGEPGVGKTRLAAEWSGRAYDQGAVVLYGRCDEDLGAPYQPFAEALRSLVPCLGTSRLRGLRGVEALLPLVPGLTDVLSDLAAPTRADPDTERYALFDAVVALLAMASTTAPLVVILDDLHWAAKPTLLLLRHLLRFGEHARLQIIGTYRSTDLDRSHPLAAMLADLHRDGSASRLQLSGLEEVDVSAYVAEAGYDDEELARALASVTGGNPFFLIEALRHVDESGGRWDPNTLPQGVREAVSRRLSRLPAETNKALAAAAVVGSRFALDLVERVLDQDLVDAFDDACKAGIVIEEQGGWYRFNHALVRQSLLAELASVRRMRLHQRIAATLESDSGDDDELLAELAHHYFECAWAGNAAKAVDYCRRAANQAMARLAYEGAADLYDKALHALEELDDELPDRDDLQTELLIARCEALLAAGEVVSATGAVSQLQHAAGDSARLAAWGTCFDGQLSMLTDPERLDDVESAVAAAAERLAELDDAAGEAKAHTVRAGCLGRLGRVGDCETALDQALTAARRAGEHRLVNAVLANAPLAALWGPNPVPRAGGRCLDVVRLLRITTGSPVVEATSTRCQGVLDAFRGRAAAGRQLIDSARRSLTELGMRHALLEVDQFAGIVELVADDPAAAEAHLRRAYNGFRRMGLDADTAETAALLARAYLALNRDADADELCVESERLAGHALKASITWRTVRAQLLARHGEHDEARRVAEEAVALAGRTDALVDHGDACLALAMVLDAAGDVVSAKAAADKAVDLYEQKGAAALAEKARKMAGKRVEPSAPAAPQVPVADLENACARAGERVIAAIDRRDWDEVERMFALDASIESRRKIVGFTHIDLATENWRHENRRILETSAAKVEQAVIAVRGERLALARLMVGTADLTPGAPRDDFLQLYGIDEHGRIGLQVFFDLDDMDAAMAELDAAHARLQEPQPRAPVENTATRADDRLIALFGGDRLDEISALFSEDTKVDDRRHGLRRESDDRATAIANIRAIAALEVAVTKRTLAVRGDRLCLSRIRFEQQSTQPTAFCVEALEITEVNAEGLMTAKVGFDLDDFDAAITEIDARYLVGEAAAHAQMWSKVARAYATLNQQELPATTPDWINIDHRRLAPVEAGHLAAYVRDAQSQWGIIFIEAVHRLSDVGAVVSRAIDSTSSDGFEAEWREIDLLTFDGDRISRLELFDESDLDVALASFDELSCPVPILENAASRAYRRFEKFFASRDWDAMREIATHGVSVDDRRRTVNAGLRHGVGSDIEDLRAAAGAGFASITASIIATRGEHLALGLARASASGSDQPDSFHGDAFCVIEVDADERFAAVVVFDADDIDAAFVELDARFVAGEAAAHVRTWSAITRNAAAFNQREPLSTAQDWVTIDHRRATAFEPGDMTPYIHATWDVAPDINLYIEDVHRLNDLGAVFTQVLKGASKEGFDAEWRDVIILTVDGEQLTRCEIFDEADLDAAIDRFEELQPRTPKLENAASRVGERFDASFAIRDWDGIAEILMNDTYVDDRRRVVNSGPHYGRDAEIASIKAIAEVGAKNITATTIATRGERLTLRGVRYVGRDPRPHAFHTDVLDIVDIETNGLIAARIVFDHDDIEAAFEELESRYFAGEAAAHANTWSAIVRITAEFNRREVPATTPNFVSLDRRHGGAFAPGELTAYLFGTWDLSSQAALCIEAVHRLDDLGAVVTHVGRATSHNDFAAEWRVINVVTVDGEQLTRCEIFDESDLDTALARFDELNRPTPQLENAATKVIERFLASFTARDWDALADLHADGFIYDDRRRPMNAGVRHGREFAIENLRASLDIGVSAYSSSAAIATRGGRLTLMQFRASGNDPEAIQLDILLVVETDADERLAACVLFDLDDIDAAFEELDAHYLTGEAAAYAHTWSVVARNYAAFNRHVFPSAAPDWVTVDHRRGASFEPGDLAAYIRSAWDIVPDITVYIEAVHRLRDSGAVFTQVSKGTTQQGFDVEWRELCLVTVDGELVNRAELFDEGEIDSALARFGELDSQTACQANTASRADDRFFAYFAARDWAALGETLADQVFVDDRRRVVNVGFWNGRDAVIASLQALAEAGPKVSSAVVATRGERLALSRIRSSRPDRRAWEVDNEMLQVVEIDTDEAIVAHIEFEPADIDAAIAELDARYLAGEATLYSHTWSVVTTAYAAVNRHESPPTTPDLVTVDHRQGTPFAPGHLAAIISSPWDVTPNLHSYVETVHLLNNDGAVITQVSRGAADGFDAEWRLVIALTVDGDRYNRCEIFDESDLDAALARFDELGATTPPLENASTRALARAMAAFNRRDIDSYLAVVTTDGRYEDRRKGLRDEGAIKPDFARTLFFEAAAGWQVEFEPVAIRGSRLALCRVTFRDHSGDDRPIAVDTLVVTEVTDDELIARFIIVDPDDINGAMTELTARWIASGEVAHPEIIEAHRRLLVDIANRHDWDTFATLSAGAAYVGHGQLAVGLDTIADYISSIRMLASLVPDLWLEPAEILSHSALGVGSYVVVKGTSTEGAPIELPLLILVLFDGDRVSRVETFDVDQRAAALARFEELSASGGSKCR
ncbi:BTAD domain-containing putative transcriptional regulator [Mycobacterium sp. IS-3022]|uniref:BTAD domain-containing putative transcriptional regulator n=1 Tax=Mycobacterium sp. IS-3022 TaxID=1772277 RepID=UPI0007416B76|nr:BTAD domain-containing putative transcriptional regulator [Mycobacterium sp. IS-3022]KUI03956.1 hypothetical protein AU188_23940 [Mycobacterium sp. IS-3022]